MSSLVYSLGGVILLQIAAFFILYRFTRWLGKHVALLVALMVVGLYIPIGVLTWRSLDYFAIHFAFFIMVPYVLGIITTHWEARRKEAGDSAKKQFFHWGPAALVIFFIVLATVDALIITMAEKGLSARFAQLLLPEPTTDGKIASMFPGSVTHDFQEKESLFNEYKAQRELQKARGWRVRKGWVQRVIAGKPAIFKIAVTDREGKPVTGATVGGRFLRPSDSRLDQAFTMRETGAGIYQTDVTLQNPGSWSVVFTIVRDGETHEVRAATEVKTP